MTVQTTEFGKEIKKKLIDIDKTQAWLIGQVKERTGLYVDSSYMCKILAGKATPDKITTAIRDILDISDTA